MNGLEAIKVMMEGKLVSKFNSCMEDEIYKIIDGNVCVKFEDEPDEKYEVSEDFDFDTTYHEYIEPKSLTGWERVGENESYYHIGCNCCVEKLIEERCMEDKYYYEDANYFSTEEKAEEIDFKQTLFRKLQRFSDENGSNENERRYYIVYNSYADEFEAESHSFLIGVGQVRFASKKIAQQAINLFHDDLIKYFTM